jgi:hypothetical protein
MQFMSQIRAFPDTDIPADKFFKAFEYSKTRMQELQVDASPTEWSSIGPNNIGGKAFHWHFIRRIPGQYTWVRPQADCGNQQPAGWVQTDGQESKQGTHRLL